ncbi:DUF1925 domain-containing protein [bacterium]|nr:DUF1925 domain-containing protein [bacterium]
MKEQTQPHRQGRILLPLLFHLHQPVGNFPGTFEYAFRRSYQPLLNALDESGLPFNLHISGGLLDWLVAEQPSYIEQLRGLVGEGRLELLGGGYYEPILTMLPPDDRQRQLLRLADRVEELFGVRPRGAWLAERVWEPILAGELHRAGYRYTLLDEAHFRGLVTEESGKGKIFATEDGGLPLAIFPIDEELRYLIPWKEPEETLAYLSQQRPQHDETSVVTVMNDGEKLGLWPGTHEVCYEEGWARRFLTLLRQTDWLRPLLLSEALATAPPTGSIYLPTGSYDKMGLWALPTESRKKQEQTENPQSTRGTLWRNFLIKYPAAFRLHRLYLYVHDRLNVATKLSKAERESLHDKLDQAAVNDGYWHGLFGGVYYHFLRHHCYARLAEVLARLDEGIEPQTIRLDYERLGRGSNLLIDRRQTVVLDHRGEVLDWLAKEPALGLAGGFTRIAEAYHQPVEENFTVDSGRRGFLRLLFLTDGATVEDFLADQFIIDQSSAIQSKFEEVKEESLLWRSTISLNGSTMELKKRYELLNDRWQLLLTLNNQGEAPVRLTSLLDCSPSPPSGPVDLRLRLRTGVTDISLALQDSLQGKQTAVSRWSLTDERLGVEIFAETTPDLDLHWAAVETIEQTEAGSRRSWQGLQVVMSQRLTLQPGEMREISVAFGYRSL